MEMRCLRLCTLLLLTCASTGGSAASLADGPPVCGSEDAASGGWKATAPVPAAAAARPLGATSAAARRPAASLLQVRSTRHSRSAAISEEELPPDKKHASLLLPELRAQSVRMEVWSSSVLKALGVTTSRSSPIWGLVLFMVGMVGSPLVCCAGVKRMFGTPTAADKQQPSRSETPRARRGVIWRPKSPSIPEERLSSSLLGPACFSPRPSASERAPPSTVRPDERTSLSNVRVLVPAPAKAPPAQGWTEEFCPDLVVPAGSVCNLLVPTSVSRSQLWTKICNRDGTALVQVIFKDSSPQRVLLQDPSGTALGEAKAASAQEFIFYNRLSKYVAKLTRGDGPEHFKLTTSQGAVWHYRGRLVDFEVQVSDDSGCVVAKTEKYALDRAPSRSPPEAGWGCIAKSGRAQRESYFATIFGPGTDVGLLLCGFLCMQILSIPQERNSV